MESPSSVDLSDENILGTLWAQLLLTVFHWLFWNFSDVFCMEWRYSCGLDIILRLFFLTFSALWTSFFQYEMLSFCHSVTFQLKIYWVPCRLNSSYSFPWNVLKLCRYFLHGMKMCIWFGYNTLSIFLAFFLLCELCLLFDMKCYRSV